MTIDIQEPRKSWRGAEPRCDFCQPHEAVCSTFYDAATKHGPWAIMCEGHYKLVGLPMGQKYQHQAGTWYKVCDLADEHKRQYVHVNLKGAE